MEIITIVNGSLFLLFILTLLSDILDALDILYLFSSLTLLTTSLANENNYAKLLNHLIHPVLILLSCLSILSLLFKKSNILTTIIKKFTKIRNPCSFICYLLTFSCLTSGFLNNALIVSSLIPVIMELSKLNDWKAQQFLMPLSFASMLGGTITTIGSSTNLVAISLLEPEIKIGILDLAIYSLPTAFIGLIYLLIVYRWCNLTDTLNTCFKETSTHQNIDIKLIFVKITTNSEVINMTIKDAHLQELFGLQLCGIQRGDTFSALPPRSFTMMQENDILTFIGFNRGNLTAFTNYIKSANERGLYIIEKDELNNISQPNIAIGRVGKYFSPLVNKKCKEIGFKIKYHSVILCILRNNEIINKDIGELSLKANDFIVVHGTNSIPDTKSKLSKICNKVVSLSGINYSNELNSIYTDILLILILVLIIISGFIKIVTVSLITLISVLILLLIGSINKQDIGTAIKEYKNIILGTATSLLFTASLEKSQVILNMSYLTNYLKGYPNWQLYFIYHLISSSLSILLSNVAVVSILIPVVKISYLGSNLLTPISYCIIHGASCCFASPTGYHTNLMIHNIGNYSCRDYLRSGLPLHLICSLVFSTCLSLWPPV